MKGKNSELSHLNVTQETNSYIHWAKEDSGRPLKSNLGATAVNASWSLELLSSERSWRAHMFMVVLRGHFSVVWTKPGLMAAT